MSTNVSAENYLPVFSNLSNPDFVSSNRLEIKKNGNLISTKITLISIDPNKKPTYVDKLENFYKISEKIAKIFTESKKYIVKRDNKKLFNYKIHTYSMRQNLIEIKNQFVQTLKETDSKNKTGNQEIRELSIKKNMNKAIKAITPKIKEISPITSNLIPNKFKNFIRELTKNNFVSEKYIGDDLEIKSKSPTTFISQNNIYKKLHCDEIVTSLHGLIKNNIETILKDNKHKLPIIRENMESLRKEILKCKTKMVNIKYFNEKFQEIDALLNSKEILHNSQLVIYSKYINRNNLENRLKRLETEHTEVVEERNSLVKANEERANCYCLGSFIITAVVGFAVMYFSNLY